MVFPGLRFLDRRCMLDAGDEPDLGHQDQTHGSVRVARSQQQRQATMALHLDA
jgi:hypothetical protein